MAGQSVVIVGAGQAGSDAAAALRSQGHTGPITLIGEESHLPYQRPPLSKAYLYPTGGVGLVDLELRPASFYDTQGVELLRGEEAVRIDRETRSLGLRSGRELRYDSLVLATGARPRKLPVPGAERPGVFVLRGADDAEALRQRLAEPDRTLNVVVIGAGFIGLELASTATRSGHRVTVVEAQPRVLQRALTEEMSDWLTAEHRSRGVRLLLRREVAELLGDGSGPVRAVRLGDGEELPADLAVVGIGVLPNVDLAVRAGLAVGDGILVDEHLRTSDPAIFAIGDCARFPSRQAGRPMRLESVQNASDQARCVAAAICGTPEPYTALPWFWSEQYGHRLQIAGLTAGHDRTVLLGHPAQARFSVLCFREGRLIGAESVNRAADHGIVRRLLTSGAELTPEQVAVPGFDLKDLNRQLV